ncbi:MAG: fatty acid desaturase [Tabrizicola sp.]|nr:fatty acid desaturase [Tabrizicola sp.]
MPAGEIGLRSSDGGFEWPTVLLLIVTYLLWSLATTVLWQLSPGLSVAVLALAIAQFSSLQHEVLHGHPFRSRLWSEATVFPALTLYVPYLRFKDLHLRHHHDPHLTDPYDDPESNYHDPAVWARLPRAMRWFLRLNNTLAGRMLFGPAISLWALVRADARAILRGERRVLLGWALHGAGFAVVLAWLRLTEGMPLWAYAVAAYLGWSLLKIRTFLEHRAHRAARARSVVVESRGPLSLLFLNNNFHAVHHSCPGLAWYRLPALYFANREGWLQRNEAYVYKDYTEILRAHLFRPKDPVAHPIWPMPNAAGPSEDAVKGGNVGAVVEERHTGLIAALE